MRIQETDRILKESRHARHANALHGHEGEGMMRRLWRRITALFT
jgi:hypothetical protein